MARIPQEKGMVQYFYHSPSSKLPIRDVLNEQGHDHKTEPHLEIGAENLCAECYQSNIQKFAEKKLRYLFLITTCKNEEVNKELEKKFGTGTKQFIVGYIDVRENFPIEGHICVKGPTYIYSFEDSKLVKPLFGFNFDRPKLKKNPFVNETQTEEILNHFLIGKKTPITHECIEEISKKDKGNKTCRFGDECKFRKDCRRFS
jgi:hypothetical protein